MGKLSKHSTNEYMNSFSHNHKIVVVLRPTGWTFHAPKKGVSAESEPSILGAPNAGSAGKDVTVLSYSIIL
jgi:hypothetical protein